MLLQYKIQNGTATPFEQDLYNLKMKLIIKHVWKGKLLFNSDIRREQYKEFHEKVKLKYKIKNF